jgi:hypothetical protein
VSRRKWKSRVSFVDSLSGNQFAYWEEPIHVGQFIGENLPPIEELLLVVHALNGKELYYPGPREEFADYDRMLRETPLELRELVDAWLSSGPNLEKFRQDHPKRWADAIRYWKNTPTNLVPVGSGGGVAIALGPEPGRNSYEEALRFFVWLITNRECDKLAGPCARCGDYYIRRRRSSRNKVYCSRACGQRTTARAATDKRRKQEHEDKLHRAAKLIREWEGSPKKDDWKTFASKRGDISVQFLTRAVNNGELKSPTKGKKQ